MARGGFISPEIALKNLVEVSGDRARSKQLIVDALASKILKSKGKRVIEWIMEPVPKGQLRDLVSAIGSAKVVLGKLSDIPPDYWEGLDAEHISETDWLEGNIICRYWSNHGGYHHVKFQEKGVNALIELCKTSSTPTTNADKTKEYSRAAWGDWVAALAFLAADGKIDGKMQVTDLFDAVTEKLGTWNLEEKSYSTVSQTLSTVIARFAVFQLAESENQIHTKN